MPRTVKSGPFSDAVRQQTNVVYAKGKNFFHLPLDKSHFITGGRKMERIGNVILDDTHYCMKYDERDTVIEEDLMQYLDKSDNSLDILSEDNRWPILYHISPVRKNILEWYDFGDNADVLEIGAECGVLTEVLCRKARRVTCIEPSMMQSRVNALRNKDFSNLKIIVSDFYKADLKKQYDYVVLIGGLEKVASIQEPEKKAQAIFYDIYQLVKENGKVLFAVQNKFGLKYWAGSPEEHTGRYFDSIEGYNATQGIARAFSKHELLDISNKSDFRKVKFYYPFPDYKFSQQIFSDEYLPKEDDLICSLDSYEFDRIQLFNETSAFRNIIMSHEFDFFSNSFFLELTK